MFIQAWDETKAVFEHWKNGIGLSFIFLCCFGFRKEITQNIAYLLLHEVLLCYLW